MERLHVIVLVILLIALAVSLVRLRSLLAIAHSDWRLQPDHGGDIHTARCR